ncbi:MAG: hypothetical protein OQK82_06415 [Candidatus Pacearchaeota archaeon]|nr:hypothetical protein [Candidatus Pacearchaeota archaeon]
MIVLGAIFGVPVALYLLYLISTGYVNVSEKYSVVEKSWRNKRIGYKFRVVGMILWILCVIAAVIYVNH